MAQLKISLEARNDLISIWVFIAEQSSQAIADKFIDQLNQSCIEISKTPNMGTSQDHIRIGLRRHIFKNYSIYYNIENEDLVVIRRFWHHKRDLDNITFFK